MSHLATSHRPSYPVLLRLLLAYLVLASALPVPAARAVQQARPKATPAPARKSEPPAPRMSGAKDRITPNALQAAGKIAFVAGAADNEVFVMNADGSAQANLTNNPAIDESPAWSPDGRALAFVSDRDGDFEIFLMLANGSGVTQLTSNAFEDAEPAWSPDGSKLAFQSDRDGNNEIYSMNADGTNQVRLTNNAAHDGKPAWSPDGSKLVFESERDGNREIYSMNADGSAPVNLTNDSAFDGAPAWSPDNTRIAFASDRAAGDEEIYTINTNGTNPIRLTNSGGFDTRPTWSPDNTRIAFNSTRTGTDNIFVMNANGASPTPLTNDPNGSTQADWQTLLSCAPPPPNGVAWYRAEDTAEDEIGANDGTFQNGASTGSGFIGAGFVFDGVDDRIDVPASAALDLTVFTVEAWIKPNSIGTNPIIVGKESSGSANYVLELLPDNRVEIDFFDGTHRVADSNVACQVGVWCHVAGTYDGATLKVYVNGTLDGSLNYVGTPPVGQPLFIGQRYNNTLPFNGLIDEVEIYSRALTAAEVKNIYDSKNAGKCLASALQTITASNTNDSGPGSLRQAILDANASPGTQTIDFNIPGAGVHTIALQSALPNITDPVVIDGYTQPGSSANTLATGDDAVLKIALNGQFAGTNTHGLTLAGGNSTVRGLVINGFGFGGALTGNGILINSNGNTVAGCFLGTDAAGTSAVQNSRNGLLIDGGDNNTIGGTSPAARNVLSGNGLQGLEIGANASGNIVQGNYTGTDKNGTAPLTNGDNGIFLAVTSDNNQIGGTTAGAGNVFSGNNQTGIAMFGTTSNHVEGNLIGVAADGTSALGNGRSGITLQLGANNNAIGGTVAGASNTIANNGFVSINGGIDIESSSTGNAILRNSIYNNIGLGIDLNQDAITPNDAGDADTGANNKQNYPIVTSAMSAGGNTTIQGTLNSAANTQFAVQFFSNLTCDPSGNGEGQTFIGATNVTTNASGDATINAPLSGSLASGTFVTATAIDPNGNTSEFSNCLLAVSSDLIVVNTNDSGAGSLRQAIIDSNNTAGTQNIVFNIPGAGVHTISPTTALTAITQPVVIDGYTQSGSSANTLATGNDAVLLVELNGAGAGAGINGLNITAGNSTVRGLVINRFTAAGVRLATGNANTVEGCFIGTNATGTADLGNTTDGVFISSSSNNTIGGTTPAARNLISGNNSDGVEINGSNLSGNLIRGNLIGTNASGAAAIANGTGVNIAGTPNVTNNTIGGLTTIPGTGAGNVISGNAANGILISGAAVSGTRVQGNIIGLSADGTADLGNASDGINVTTSPSNTIGGANPQARNVISGNNSDGIQLTSAPGNAIQNNYLGTDKTGALDLGNTATGINANACANLSVGGASAGNVISGNNTDGITLAGASGGTSITGNLVGTTASGAADLGNGGDGIQSGSASVTIGGVTAAERNVISGNGGHGINLLGASNVIRGNFIGVAADGTTGLSNNDGINIGGTVSNSVVGGTGAGEANTIAFNVGDGVNVSGTGTGNRISANSIHSNGTSNDLAIDLGTNGVTPNDANDPDTGGNNLQNFPVLTSVSSGGGATTITGTLNSTPNTTFSIEFFASQVADQSGNGEGQTFLGAASVTTDASGNVALNQTLPVTITPVAYVAATATDPANNTSEFSNSVPLATTTLTVTNANPSGVGSLLQAITDSNLIGGTQTINFNIPGGGVQTIDLPSNQGLTATDPVIIDGYTQPGSSANTLATGSDAVLLIDVVGDTPTVLTFQGGNSKVRGLVLRNSGNNGLNLDSNGNIVEGCFIGTDPTGALDRGNASGVSISGANNSIGGTTPAQRNLISGNVSGILLSGAGASANIIQGNYIGTNKAGTAALANSQSGVFFATDTSNNTLGGTVAGAGNLISGNLIGLVFQTVGNGNVVQGNLIGTDVTGTAALGNDLGMSLNLSGNTTIGGTAAGAGNTIAFNNSQGILLYPNTTPGNAFLGNSIHSNTDIGIDLNNDGVTPNDVGDADTGPNNLQNFPVLTSATASGGSTTIQGTLNSAANTQFRVEFFSNAGFCDPSGNGEGKTLLGSTDVTTDGSGNATINATLPGAALVGDAVTATATDPANNTSEFGACVQATVPPSTFTISGQVVEGANGLSGVFVTLSGSQSATTTTDPSGNYTFTNVAAGGNYVVTPSRINYTFAPTSLSFNNLSANQTANFTATLNAVTISGQVSENGGALSGVTITLSGSQSGTATTDANGNYAFNVSSGGDYVIVPSLVHYTFNPSARAVNSLTSNLTANFAATRNTHSIGGQIKDNNNSALAGVTVNLSGGQTATTTTDANGNYSFAALPAGFNYIVTPQSANYAFVPPSAAFNNLSADGTANFTGTLGVVNIGGRVADANNSSLQNVLMTLSGTQSATALTDAGGNYSFGVPMGGSYTVTPALAGYTFVPPNATFNNLSAPGTANFTGTLATHTISGRVRDTLDGNLSGVLITLSGAQSRTTTTDANGLYTFTGVPQGAYTVTPSRSGYAFSPPSKDFPNLTQDENFVFTGTPSVATPAGAPVTVAVGGFIVTYTTVNSAGITSAPPINPATAGTLPAGYILFSATRAADITTTAAYAGTVTVCTNVPTINDPQVFAGVRLLHGEGGALIDRTSSSDFNTRNVCAQTGTLSPFVLAFAQPTQPQPVSGRVLDGGNSGGNGNGVGNVTLYVTDANTGASVTSTTTDASGNYTLMLPPGGDYTITTAKSGLTFKPAARTFGNLSGGQTSDFTATPGVSIKGRVAGPNGNGVGNVIVTLSGEVTRTALTLPNGSFLFTNLPLNGNYVVQADSGLLTFSPPQIVRPALASDVTLKLVAAPRPVPIPTPPIEDDFSGTTRDPAKFTEGTLTQPPGSKDPQVSVVQEGGKLKLTPRGGIDEASFNGYVTAGAIDFTDAQASVEVDQTADNGAQTIFAVGRDERNFFRFIAQDVDDSTIPTAPKSGAATGRSLGLRRLLFQARSAGVLNGLPPSIPYDPVQHRFWRFRHSSAESAMFFETSPDRKYWTVQRRVALAGAIGAFAVELSAGTSGLVTNPGQAIFDNLSVQPNAFVNRANNVRLAQSAYRVSEGAGMLTLKAMRAGDTSRETRIDYATEPHDGKGCNTQDGAARARCDFGTTAGTIRFAPGETEKSFTVFITDDMYAEGDETVRVALGFPSAGVVEEPASALITIADNDAAGGTPPRHPINTATFLVRQQYLDFLNREPDENGFNAWVRVLTGCAFEGHFGPGKSGSDPACDRITVSSSFFRSSEFQIKGYFVYRFYKASLGRVPTYEEFLRDMTSVTGQTEAEVVARREAFANAWVERADFVALNEGITNAEFVDGLAATAGVALSNRAQLVSDLNEGRKTRAQVLRVVVDSPELFNREYNAAFVLMQYFGYLQRDPDEAGYNSWLNLLNRTGDYRTMIFGFLYSQEYLLRFGPP